MMVNTRRKVNGVDDSHYEDKNSSNGSLLSPLNALVRRVIAKTVWRVDMLVYRLFCWRWSKILKRDPAMAYLFAEWTRRYSAERPIAATFKIRIDEMIDGYAGAVTWEYAQRTSEVKG